jgi:hypothetical protein
VVRGNDSSFWRERAPVENKHAIRDLKGSGCRQSNLSIRSVFLCGLEVIVSTSSFEYLINNPYCVDDLRPPLSCPDDWRIAAGDDETDPRAREPISYQNC